MEIKLPEVLSFFDQRLILELFSQSVMLIRHLQMVVYRVRYVYLLEYR